jgi:DNA-binding response OmpR family regulator
MADGAWMVDILLVEDNSELSKLMSTFLVKDGYSVCCAMSGEEAEYFLAKDSARLVILDIMLPGIDGFAVCSDIRKKGDIPIIIVSAMVDKEAKMNGFQLGADDYIEKPVDIDILKAKIAALFKRFYDVHGNAALITSGQIVIDQDTMKVTCKGRELSLTIKEYDLLRLLVENKGKTMNKEFLFNEIWGADSFSENQTLTVHIKMLRDKIEENPKSPLRIKTVWGVGYRYEEI